MGRSGRILRGWLAPAVLALAASGCATQYETGGALSDYEQLAEAERRLVPVREYADGPALAGLTRLHLPLASVLPEAAEASGLAPARLDRVRAALSKSLCRRLARGGFDVAAAPGDGRAEVRAVIIGIDRNNVATTGVSRLIGVAVPGPINPRVPIGIGGLGVEAELLDTDGAQLAAMVWMSRNHLASGGGWTTILDGEDGFSDAADAVELAAVFADGFGDLVTSAREAADPDAPRGETPMGTCNAYYAMIGQLADAPENAVEEAGDGE